MQQNETIAKSWRKEKSHTQAYYLIDSLNDKKEEMKKHKQYY